MRDKYTLINAMQAEANRRNFLIDYQTLERHALRILKTIPQESRNQEAVEIVAALFDLFIEGGTHADSSNSTCLPST